MRKPRAIVRSTTLGLGSATVLGAFSIGLATVQLAPAADATGNTATVVVTITDSRLTLRPSTVPNGAVVFRVVVKGVSSYAFAIGGKTTRMVAHGKTALLKVDLRRGGRYVALATSGTGRRLRAGFRIDASTAILPPANTTTVTTTPSGVSTPCAQPAATTVTVTIVPPKFTFSQIAIPCGTVTFVVTNTGTLTHSLQISAPAGAGPIPVNPPILPGQTVSITVNMSVKGVYPWKCGERDDAADEGEYGNLAVQ